MKGREHYLQVRVYFEDTDLAGVVYHANYLKYAERARSEWLRSLGIPVAKINEELGLVPLVRRLSVDYRRPARMDDLLVVHTEVIGFTRVCITLAQSIFRECDEELLCTLKVDVLWVSSTGRPQRLPHMLVSKITPLKESKIT